MSRKLKKGKKEILEALEVGATYAIAAERGGVAKSTLLDWLKKGKKERAVEPYKSFRQEALLAESKGAIINLKIIQAAGLKGDWRPSAWILERRHNYKKEVIQERESEQREEAPMKILPRDYKVYLRAHAEETKRAMHEAEISKSWQAYTALSKHLMDILGQIRVIEAEEGALDKIDSLTDDQLIGEITSAIISLPPILRQRVQENLKSLSRSNVVSIRRK